MPTIEPQIRRLLGTSFAVLLLGLGIAACGGGDDEDSSAPATTTTGTTDVAALTKAALIERGDAVCAEVNAALGSIASSTADGTTKASQVADIYESLVTELRQLGTPSDGDPPTDVIAAAQDLADGESDVTEFQSAAEAYGFSDCTEGATVVTGTTGTDGSSTGTDPGSYTPPTTTEPAPADPAPADPPPGNGGGVTPAPPNTGGNPSDGGSGGNSGGIGPG